MPITLPYTLLGKAPFDILEGRSKVPLVLRTHGKIFAVVDEYYRDLRESKEAISIAQRKHKATTDKHRMSLSFKEDDWVLLKFPKARLRHTW